MSIKKAPKGNDLENLDQNATSIGMGVFEEQGINDESYLKKVLDLDSLPIDFIKKNELLRKKDAHNNNRPRVIDEIINEQTEKSLNKNLYHDKLKSEIGILKEKNNFLLDKKQKSDSQIDEFKSEKESEVENLQSQLKNINSQMIREKNNVEQQESEINELNVHYQNTISAINKSISVAKKEYDRIRLQ